jgi:hypothetical protein
MALLHPNSPTPWSLPAFWSIRVEE